MRFISSSIIKGTLLAIVVIIAGISVGSLLAEERLYQQPVDLQKWAENVEIELPLRIYIDTFFWGHETSFFYDNISNMIIDFNKELDKWETSARTIDTIEVHPPGQMATTGRNLEFDFASEMVSELTVSVKKLVLEVLGGYKISTSELLLSDGRLNQFSRENYENNKPSIGFSLLGSDHVQLQLRFISQGIVACAMHYEANPEFNSFISDIYINPCYHLSKPSYDVVLESEPIILLETHLESILS